MLAARSFLRSDCTRWPEPGLCSLTGLEAIPGRQRSALYPLASRPLLRKEFAIGFLVLTQRYDPALPAAVPTRRLYGWVPATLLVQKYGIDCMALYWMQS